MNLGINQAQNYSSPNFGMAVKVDKKAMGVIKSQSMRLSEKSKKNGMDSPYGEFWNHFNSVVEHEEANPVNIIIKKVFGRNKLKAVVVDSNAETAVKNQKFSQGLFSRNGSLNFLDDSAACANKINNDNHRLEQLTTATKADLKPGAAVEVEA